MKKYTANYCNTNHNFVIQNLIGQRIENKFLPAICILKNILQRGKPSLPSLYLQEKLGDFHKRKDFKNSFPLIDKTTPNWERIIRGDSRGNYFPAKKFYEEIIPKYLSEYLFIQQLLIPETPVNDITQVYSDVFKNQQVDFYLPQAYLIIEIDGSQHNNSNEKDHFRDNYTAKYGIETVRIKAFDLEAENETFINAIGKIRLRIEKVISKQEDRKKRDSTFISLNDYKDSFKKTYDRNNPYIISTSIIRFQILILELLENGVLKLNENWDIELYSDMDNSFAELAIQDLFQWFHPILKLQNIDWKKPSYFIKKIHSLKGFSNSNTTIKVDFSILKRYTDEFQKHSNIIFIRTDYFDEYRFFKMGNSTSELKFSSFEAYDYFKVSTTTPIKYKLQFGGNNLSEKHLLFLLQNIFLQEKPNLKFNEGQLAIISNAISGNDTIGLLPTGSGKSICYQLSAILQPAISFVVCPIKSLMYDQKSDLDLCQFNRINIITSDDEAEDKERVQNEFSRGKYFFIFISPERFQLKSFREYFSTVSKDFNFAYAVIDEVHCLSEWGHDFRTAYLNLSKTIKKLCNNFTFIGLTATASVNVLKDIQIEFGIDSLNVKTPIDYTRKELEFHVIDDNGNKLDSVKRVLSEFNDKEDIFSLKGKNSRCGIIFTPTVNGAKGCYSLSKTLSTYFDTPIKYYSGSTPTINTKTIMSNSEFDEHKRNVQNEFKKNQFTLLTATKAFGMGVNKPNIYYTIHYGLPNSMESLYQEGGRAGRDKLRFEKEKAKCFVLLSKAEKSQNILEQLWRTGTTLSNLNKFIENNKNKLGDLGTNLFFFSLGIDVIKEEFLIIQRLHNNYSITNKKNEIINGKDLSISKQKLEKAIYRLSQLGIIEDWTIQSFFGGGEFEVDYSNFSIKSIKAALLQTINKYDASFSYESIELEKKYSTYRKILKAPEKYSEFDKIVLILLQWSYDNFAYNRRQSLKNVYENCCEFADGKINSKEFKVRLENYFKFTESTFILQHVAENPKQSDKWFEIFYKINKNTGSNRFITQKETKALRDSLSRFLESYMYNPGLDLISGLVRLILDDYDNIDGRKRFESSLEEIKQFEQNWIDFILSEILKIGINLPKNGKLLLSESICKYFKEDSYLYKVNNKLEDTVSMMFIVERVNSRLRTINQRMYDKLEKIR
jgi:ATP-dependent DNA helicase RecQ